MSGNPDASPSPSTSVPPVGPTSAEPAVKFTRAGALWSALIVGFLTLIVLLIFIAQNTASTPFTFFAWHWSLPLGVAFLLAAVGGGLLTVAVGTARMLQLRHTAKKHFAAANATQAGTTEAR
jgi:uncharacterized integral membrane protein